MPTRAIIVHSLEDARTAAAAAADLGAPLTLASAPGAAAYLGALWFRQLTRIVAEEFPHVALVAILDCGDKPGHALAALRHGITHVRFTGKKSVAEKLAAIAAQSGAQVTTGRVRALDLLDEPDPPTACRRWLAKR